MLYTPKYFFLVLIASISVMRCCRALNFGYWFLSLIPGEYGLDARASVCMPAPRGWTEPGNTVCPPVDRSSTIIVGKLNELRDSDDTERASAGMMTRLCYL